MHKWFTRLFTRGISRDVYVGARVKTQYGMGTITSGAINIKYDEGTKLPTRYPTELTICHNLQNLDLESF